MFYSLLFLLFFCYLLIRQYTVNIEIWYKLRPTNMVYSHKPSLRTLCLPSKLSVTRNLFLILTGSYLLIMRLPFPVDSHGFELSQWLVTVTVRDWYWTNTNFNQVNYEIFFPFFCKCYFWCTSGLTKYIQLLKKGYLCTHERFDFLLNENGAIGPYVT